MGISNFPYAPCRNKVAARGFELLYLLDVARPAVDLMHMGTEQGRCSTRYCAARVWDPFPLGMFPSPPPHGPLLAPAAHSLSPSPHSCAHTHTLTHSLQQA